MIRWVDWVLEPHTGKLPLNKTGLLLMDNHKSHIDPELISKIKALRYDIKFLPPNTTGLVQPLGIAFNKTSKEKHSLRWKPGSADIVMNLKARNVLSPSKELLITWIHRSIKEIEPQEIITSWNTFKHYTADSTAISTEVIEQQQQQIAYGNHSSDDDDDNQMDTESELQDDELSPKNELILEFDEVESEFILLG